MNARNQPSPINRYRQLARQLAIIRWVLPLTLAFIVISVETSEHLLHNENPLYLDFSMEIVMFALVGPAIIGCVLNWIAKNLEHLARTYERIEAFNDELDKKIRLRTTELERANEELRKLDHLKSEFVSLVSHELRTPLTNIRGGLEVINADPNAICSPVTKDTLGIVQAEVNRLIRLVQRILDVSALESGQLRLNCGPVALGPLFRQIKRESLLFDENHPLELEMPPEPLMVIADEDRITDVITNLLSNAIKYSPQGGAINVRLTSCDNRVQISVKDHGIGIAFEEQQHLMQQFYRGRMGSNMPGYGLGLYFASKLVEAHGSKLEFESTGIPGEGSEFHFSLPADKDMG
ncbi:MAG: ATP-binding protein [Chloroflexota bacterium]